MSYKLVPAQPSDVGDMITIFLAAFEDDPLLGRMWTNVSYEKNYAYWAKVFEKTFEVSKRDAKVWNKVVDENGIMVAFAEWQYPHTLTPKQKAEKDAGDKEDDPLPEGFNVELRKTFSDALDAGRKKWIDPSRDYFLHLLAVSPSHQRRGLGSMLIEEGLDVADANNAKTYIEASPKGVQLYLRHGWKQVDDILIDVGKFGEQGGVQSEKCFVRQPGGKQDWL